MTGRTHDMAAFTTLTAVVVMSSLPHMTLATGITAVVANLMGGIAPDIDQPTAPLWKNLPIGRYVGRTFDKFLGGHRFLSHSILGAFIFGFLFHYILNVLRPSFPNLNMTIIWWAFMFGFGSHLIMDTLTTEGVPWLLPIPFKFGIPPIKAFRIQTDGLIERFIVFPGLMLVTVYLIYLHYDKIKLLLHSYLK
ncbi:MAG TPA: metal-dependent hydrolase [Candidatus Saccharimonadales bacterium]|nr:metal-dependent hydrolase [Candidatus Saccharimonadales bacterium]